jgi:hypothetical protein
VGADLPASSFSQTFIDKQSAHRPELAGFAERLWQETWCNAGQDSGVGAHISERGKKLTSQKCGISQA